MVSYEFTGVYTNKKSIDLLKELRSSVDSVVGCCIRYADRVVIVEFDKDVDSNTLNKVKSLLKADSFTKVEEIEEV